MRVCVFCVVVMVAAVVTLTPACEAPRSCTPSSCQGCCDANQVCQPGTTVGSCGVAGASCQTCDSNAQCALGQCTPVVASGGGSGGGGGTLVDAGAGGGTTGGGSASGGGSGVDAGTCGSSCAGCCQGGRCIAPSAYTDELCGSANGGPGTACASCVSGGFRCDADAGVCSGGTQRVCDLNHPCLVGECCAAGVCVSSGLLVYCGNDGGTCAQCNIFLGQKCDVSSGVCRL